MNKFITDFRRPDAPEDPLPEEIAPREDNPLRGWLRWGMVVAGSWTRISEPALWPREFNHNPMLVYLTARRQGQHLEDWLGLAPWILLSLFEFGLTVAIVDPTQFGEVLKPLAVLPLLAAPFVGLWSLRMTARSLNETFRRISFDQIAVTRLSGAEVLHGLAIRPLAVQTMGCLLNTLLWLPVLVAGVSANTGSTVGFFYQIAAGVGLLLLRWTLFSSCIMEGTALAARACCFIRSEPVAYVRMWVDWARRMLIPMAILVVLAILTMAILILAVPLAFGAVIVLAYYVRLGFTAEDVMRWVATYSMDWWPLALEEKEFAPTLPWSRWRSPDPEFTYVPQP